MEEEEDLCNIKDECIPKSGGRSQDKIKWKNSSFFTFLSFKTCESPIFGLPIDKKELRSKDKQFSCPFSSVACMLSIELDEEVASYGVESQLSTSIQIAQDSSQAHLLMKEKCWEEGEMNSSSCSIDSKKLKSSYLSTLEKKDKCSQLKCLDMTIATK